MKKNWLYSILMAIPLMSGLTACNNEDDPNPNPNPNPELLVYGLSFIF